MTHFLLLVLLAIDFSLATPNKIAEEMLVENNNLSVCITSGCVKAAAAILNNLDETINPCEDFYQFACGGFIKDTVIPEDKSRVSYFNIVGDRILTQLQVLLEKPIQSSELKPFLLAKKLYNMCMNTDVIQQDNLTSVRTLLSKLGGWPVIEGRQWKENQFDWRNTMYDFRRNGLRTDGFLSVFVGQDVHNSSLRIIDIDHATLGLDREYLIEGFSNKVVKAYYDLLVDVAINFGASKEAAKKEIRDAVSFEIALAKINLPQEERRNITALTNVMTVSQLQHHIPAILWQEYINKVIATPDIELCPYDVVDVGVPNFLKKLVKLLERTPKRVQANYLFYQVVSEAIIYLTKELRDRKLKYKAIAEGKQQMEPRWKECTTLVATELNLASDALYVREYFNEESKKIAEELVANLKATFKEMLYTVDWMDDSTREKAIDKAVAIEAHVAYPRELLDDHTLETYYEQLNPPTENLFEFILDVEKFSNDISYKRLYDVVNKTDWTEHSFVTTVNAYYNGLENSIQLPAGILQGHLFDSNRPNYLNYGSIGFAIGHEMTHGFDDVGRQFDKDGTLKQWWANKTEKAFLEKAQCVINQYSNYTAIEVGLNLNGINTQGENIADNGGVKEGYLAYQSWTKHNGEEPRLPGLNYSPNQLFWISTANLWCTKQRTENLRRQILTDLHSPANFRVLGSLRNSKHFSNDFNCPLGSSMNPIEKCDVW